MKCIVRHKDDLKETSYLERWYGYKPAHDKYNPTHHMPQHFIRRCYEHQRRVEQRRPHVKA